jgi:hypothetical protein
MIRRRGKKKKKKSKAEEAKDLEKEFKGLAEPGETLVSRRTEPRPYSLALTLDPSLALTLDPRQAPTL